MALNIPNTTDIGEAFGKGMEGTSNMIYRMMQPKLKREEMAQEWKKHLDQLALSKAAAGRASQAASDAHKLAMMKLDPDYEINQMKHMMSAFGMGGQEEPQEPTQQESYMPSIGFMNNEPQQPPEQLPELNQDAVSPYEAANQPKNTGALNMDSIKQSLPLRMWFKKHYGIDPGAPEKENPDIKREKDLASKISLENTKSENKQKAIETKEINAAKKDIPVIEESIKNVDDLLKIAKENPDIFGHSFMPDLYAKTSKNKKFGEWQSKIAPLIANLESKMSAKGNIVALKMAAGLKPSHAEQQNVAIGKLEAMKKELMASRERSHFLAHTNSNYSDTDMVIVEGPNGDQVMTYAEAKRLGAE